MTTWPVAQDFNEAIQSPGLTLADPDLHASRPVTNALGLPLPRSGSFADVYQMASPATGQRWAVKCFTRSVADLRERYQAISTFLNRARLPFMVDFQYLQQGIRVKGRWFPVVKMPWVEGLLLNEFVQDALDKPALLDALTHVWLRLSRRLREAGLAHADLQHGNVILVPGNKASSLAVKLIDYDGMFVPALAGLGSAEVGHPAYQHPRRLREHGYNRDVDRFSLLVVATALRCLRAAGPDLWRRYNNGDNLLFREADLRDPPASELFRELGHLGDPQARLLVSCLAESVRWPPERVPWVDEVLADWHDPEPDALPLATLTGAEVSAPAFNAPIVRTNPYRELEEASASWSPAAWSLLVALALVLGVLIGILCASLWSG